MPLSLSSRPATTVVKEFHTAQTTTQIITTANIAPIMFVKVPLRSSCIDLHTHGSLNAIRDCTHPHTPIKGFVPLIMRPMHLPRATAHLGFVSCAPTRRNFRSRAAHALPRASTTLADVSPRCAIADVICLRQPLTSSFDSRGLTVDFSGLTIDFD